MQGGKERFLVALLAGVLLPCTEVSGMRRRRQAKWIRDLGGL